MRKVGSFPPPLFPVSISAFEILSRNSGGWKTGHIFFSKSTGFDREWVKFKILLLKASQKVEIRK